MMPNEVVMPRLSDTMEEGTLLRWLKHPGDTIRKGEAIAEVETDKATMEVEAFEDGTLGDLLVQEGESIPVGQPIARLNGAQSSSGQEAQQKTFTEAREGAPPREPERGPQAPSSEKTATGRDIPEEGPHKLTHLSDWGGQPDQRSRQTVLSPSQRRERRETEQEPERQVATKERGETSRKTPEEKPQEERVYASPRARKVAREQGVDLQQVRGSGPQGRIVESDVRQHRTETQERERSEASARKGESAMPEVPSRMRRTIASRMTCSKQEIPHFYVTAVVRADALTRLRKRLQQKFELSFNDLILKACALALRRHPRLNSHYRDENIQPNSQVNLAMAVAVPGGLLTPVIHDADQLSVEEIAERSREVAARARTDELRPEDLSGATFTVSNMGMYRLESFTAIINPPQAGILAVGPIRAVPVVENGAVIPGYEMRISLSADHRVVNGAEAAVFLDTLTHLLENPVLLAEAESLRNF